MTKHLLLLWVLAFALHNCKAQQIYECKAMGFKFVMDCQCAEQDMKYPKPGQTYKMNMIPLVTYVAEGSPAAALKLTRAKLHRVGDTILYNKTPEQIIAIFSNPSIAGKDLSLYSTFNAYDYNPKIPANYAPANYTFPQAKFAPVPGGPLLLATILQEFKKTGALSVLYENGDLWEGQVVHEMYPRYSDKKGKYYTHDSIMKTHFDKNKPYQDSLVVARKQFIIDSIAAKIINDKKIIEMDSLAKIYAAQMLVKHKIDSVNNLKTAKQLISMIDDSGFVNHLVCGVGIDIKLTDGAWAITEVENYSPAWLAGLKVGDRLIGVGGNNSIYAMSKEEILRKLCNNMNSIVSLAYMRPKENYSVDGLKADMHCFKIYNRPASLSKGGCLTGDCQNGTGIFEDAQGNIYDGMFVNGKLNYTGTITMPRDSMVVNSIFNNGMKNGRTTIYTGRPVFYRPNNTGDHRGAYKVPILFECDFINDVPDGYGIICNDLQSYYYMRYQNGIVQGKALRIVNNYYSYCDLTPRYTLTNCLHYEGTPTDLSMIEPDRRADLTTGSTTNTNSNTTSNPFAGGSENLIPNLRSACRAMQESGYTWHDGGPITLEPSGGYAETYETFIVPANKSLKVYFAMEPGETDKIQFLPKNMSYIYENLDGGAPVGYGSDVGGLVYLQIFSISNRHTKEGRVMIVIRGLASTEYRRRTIYYVWGISQ